jgi:hypothetical protein
MKESAGGHITPQYPDKQVAYALLMRALGTSDADFLQGILDQLVEICFAKRGNRIQDVNFIIGVMKGVQPKSQTESLLGLNVGAIQLEVSRAFRELSYTELGHPKRKAVMDELSQLLKTLCLLTSTIKKNQGGGEQKITVQYVSVADGSQAIVGDVTQNVRQDPQVMKADLHHSGSHPAEAPAARDHKDRSGPCPPPTDSTPEVP